ncbi:Fic family protein [Oryzomonas sagensis]|uniref:Fic family protein n=1 Tax=Oryzomonas sagensis TaxID=2603857 RepID=A0ABQ6TUS5_9BACT|nr:Fic family protein [Oryzomonas sagensis]
MADNELTLIEKCIAGHQEGVGVSVLEAELSVQGLVIQRRTLLRRLAVLHDWGRIALVGEKKGRIYQPVIRDIYADDAVSTSIASEASLELYIPLSSESEEIKAYVRQPRQMRKPIGYNQSFLEAYYPNETSYLPVELREQLRQIGTPPEDERPAGTFARDILNRLLIDLSWASSRLEGNTYSRLDTQRLIEFGQAAEGKDAFETQMILNHKAAIELLVNEADLVDFTPFTILNLHALLSDGLLSHSSACGKIRHRPVDIGGSVYLPIAMPQRLEELFRIILSTTQEIRDPFEQAFFLMVHLPYLQPFEDVNKRVSRLAANIPLIRHNLCPLSFIDVPARAYVEAVLGVYELNRTELLRDVFVWAYERSCQHYLAIRQELVPPDIFRLRYRQALSETVRAIVQQQQRPTSETVTAVTPSSVAAEDHNKFVELVLEEFENLHEGNAIRFGIRPLEFAAWQEQAKP